MSDKASSKLSAGAGTGQSGLPPNKPVPMKLFSTWEVDRTPSNCIPRLCSLTLARLLILRPLGSDLASISIAVKMQSSKRTLRSIELTLPPSGLLDTALELSFSLQYPHFLKRDGNRLHVLLQRRKRYKNRTMLGYKTLAVGIIRMDQVMQRQMDLELDLNGEGKDKGVGPIARMKVLGLSSTPVDHEHHSHLHKSDRGDRDFSDDDEDFSSNEDEPVDLSDSEPLRGGVGGAGPSGTGAVGGGKISSGSSHGRHNLKQRFISLLKRFRVADVEEGGRGTSLANNTDIQALFEELESLSCDDDSAGEQDTMSISSTPKPSIRPFFASSRSLLDNNPTTYGSGGYQPYYNSVTPPQQSPQGLGGPSSYSTTTFYDMDLAERNNYSGSDGNADFYDYDGAQHSDTQQTGSPPRTGERVLLVPGALSSRLRSESDSTADAGSGGGVGGGGGGVATAGGTAAASGAAICPSGAVEKKTKLFRTSTGANKKKHSVSVSSDTFVRSTPDSVLARKTFLDTMACLLPLEEPGLPDTVAFIVGPEPQTSTIASRLAPAVPRLLQPISATEVKAAMQTIFTKLNKHYNSCGKPTVPIRILLIGGDTLVGWTLRPYVDLLSRQPADWSTHIRIYIVPLGSSAICRQIGVIDAGYASLFPENYTTTTICGTPSVTPFDVSKADDFVNRVQRYLAGGPAAPITQLPLAEAMLTCCQDDTASASQLFIPFVSEVRVGPADSAHSLSSVDLDDTIMAPLGGINSSTVVSSASTMLIGGSGANSLTTIAVGTSTSTTATSAQNAGASGSGLGMQANSSQPPLTPPSSPNVQVRESPWEPLELQLDYWQFPGAPRTGDKSDKTVKSDGKTSFKGLFRGIQASPGLNVAMQIANKEKKQKIMRLGKKKDKDGEARAHCVESISRLICSAKPSNVIPMRVLIDGAEWTGVKFFQLSNTWQTHVKTLNVALTGVPLAICEQ